MVSPLGTSIQQLRRRLVLVDGVELGSRGLFWGALGLGTLALVARAGFGLDANEAAWFFLPLAVWPLGAAFVARRRGLDEGQASAWLDAASGGKGALVTEHELHDVRWSGQVDAQLAALPGDTERVDLRRAGRRVAGAAAFAAAVLAVPVASIRPSGGLPPGIFEPALERLQEKLAALDEVVRFAPEEARELAAAVARLEEEAAQSADPEATFEAIARLDERLERTATETLDAAQRVDEQLAEAQARAQQGESPSDTLQGALDALSKSPIDLAPLANHLPPGLELGPLGLTLPEGMHLDPALAGALSEELRALLAEQLAALGAAGLLDAKALAGLGQGALIDPADLADVTFEELEPCPLCQDLEPGAT